MAWTHMNDAQGDRWVLPKQSYLTAALAVAGIVRGLVNTTGLWTIIEAYSTASGDKRRTPSVATTLDNSAFTAGADFGWQTGTLGAGDWIVLQSTNSSGAKCEIYIEYGTTTAIRFCLLPYNDFVTNGTDVTPPNGPQGFNSGLVIGSTAGTSPTRVVLLVQNATMDYSVIADTSTVIIIADDGTVVNRRRMYIGGLSVSHPDDATPFAISTHLLPGGTTSVTTYMARISPFDNTTAITNCFQQAAYAGSTAIWMSTTGLEGKNDKWTPDPLVVCWYQVSNYFRSVLKHSYLVGMDLSTSGTLSGTLGSKAYMYMNSAAAAREAWDWDLATVYP